MGRQDGKDGWPPCPSCHEPAFPLTPACVKYGLKSILSPHCSKLIRMSVESRSESRFIVRLFVKLFSLVVGVVLAIVIGAFVIYLLAGFNSVMIYNPTLGRLYPILHLQCCGARRRGPCGPVWLRYIPSPDTQDSRITGQAC